MTFEIGRNLAIAAGCVLIVAVLAFNGTPFTLKAPGVIEIEAAKSDIRMAKEILQAVEEVFRQVRNVSDLLINQIGKEFAAQGPEAKHLIEEIEERIGVYIERKKCYELFEGYNEALETSSETLERLRREQPSEYFRSYEQLSQLGGLVEEIRAARDKLSECLPEFILSLLPVGPLRFSK